MPISSFELRQFYDLRCLLRENSQTTVDLRVRDGESWIPVDEDWLSSCDSVAMTALIPQPIHGQAQRCPNDPRISYQSSFLDERSVYRMMRFGGQQGAVNRCNISVFCPPVDDFQS